MLPYTIEEIICRVTPVAQKYRLAAVYLFGSYARGEATEISDIDLLVDLTGSSAHGIRLGALYIDLQEVLDAKIDLITLASLEQPNAHRSARSFREAVKRDRVMIYATA